MSDNGDENALNLAMSATCVLHALLRDMQRRDPDLADRLLRELDDAEHPEDQIVQDARTMLENLKNVR